jgi:hypothetical protein
MKDEQNDVLSHWCCPIIYPLITGEILIDLLECCLREFKILVVEPNLSLLSAAVLSLLPLVRPLNWAGSMCHIIPPIYHTIQLYTSKKFTQNSL